MNTKASLGVIIGNRDFFPDRLVSESHADIIALFDKLNIIPIMLGETDSKLGGVETFKDAQKCADLFRKHHDEISGILVLLPNFGDEKGVADTIKLSGLNVPVLIQAYPDDLNKLDVARRRDSWCGKHLNSPAGCLCVLLRFLRERQTKTGYKNTDLQVRQ